MDGTDDFANFGCCGDVVPDAAAHGLETPKAPAKHTKKKAEIIRCVLSEYTFVMAPRPLNDPSKPIAGTQTPNRRA